MPKRKRLTKAEKLRRKNEKLLEQQRQKRLEEEEAQRIEDARLAEEKRKKDEAYAIAEKARLDIEIMEMQPFNIALKTALDEQIELFQKQQEWNRYMEKGDNAIPFDKKEIADLYTRYFDMSKVELSDHRNWI